MTRARAIDWDSLPRDVEPRSLWACLHDGILHTIVSDRLERTLRMTFEVAHVAAHRGMSEDTRFTLLFSDVTAVRARESVKWPGEAPDTAGMSRAEQTAALEAYWAKWRIESMDWSRLEAEVTEHHAMVRNADLAASPANVAVQLEVMIDSGAEDAAKAATVFVRARAVTVVCEPSGETVSLNELDAWGEAFWEAFSSREPDRTEPGTEI